MFDCAGPHDGVIEFNGHAGLVRAFPTTKLTVDEMDRSQMNDMSANGTYRTCRKADVRSAIDP
jgi:hypothetical protein